MKHSSAMHKTIKAGVYMIAAFAGMLTAPVYAQSDAQTDAAEDPAGAPYVMPETEVWDMDAAHGERYRIYVSRPDGDAPEGGYPVLYVLDGNAMFAGFAEARRIQSVYDKGLDKMIVVAIGYPKTELYDGRRLGDSTPPIETPELKEMFAAYPSGKQDEFSAFLLDEVRPEIERRYSVDKRRQSLFGHSLGGLFALHILYTKPSAFHTIVATSPSIWWDNQSILEEERAFTSRLKKKPFPTSRVVLLTGELEEEEVVVGDTIALGKRLEALSGYGLRSGYAVLDKETHITVPARAVTATMRAVMQRP